MKPNYHVHIHVHFIHIFLAVRSPYLATSTPYHPGKKSQLHGVNGTAFGLPYQELDDMTMTMSNAKEKWAMAVKATGKVLW